MPYSGSDDPNLPPNVKKLTANQRDKWVKTWNNTFKNCKDDGTGGGAGDTEKCEQLAFRIANGTIKKEVEVVENKALERVENCEHGIPKDKCIACISGATSFEEAEQAQAAQKQANELQETITLSEGLAMNVLRSEDIPPADKPKRLSQIVTGLSQRLGKIIGGKQTEKAVTKTEGGVNFRASDYAIVPDLEKPSSWKLRMAEGSSGSFSVAQVARAVTAMQPQGFRGQKVDLAPGDKKQAISRIRAAIDKTDGSDDQKDNLRRRLNAIKEKLPLFSIMKDKDGNMRWIGIPSNKWRDRDNPPQIIEEAAHKEFIEWLDRTKQYPVLLSWHTPGTRMGIADFADYSDGFLIMGGPIDKDRYADAEKLAEKCQIEEVGMSHGFVYTYSDKEREIIGSYRTWEVSHLPLAQAANVWTAIDVINKEVKQMLDPEKRKYLVDLHGEEIIAGIESRASDLAKDIDSAGIEFKELDLTAEEKADPGDAVKALVESEGFKLMVTTVKDVADAVKDMKEVIIPSLVERLEAVETKSKETVEKAKKSTDDLISELLTSKSGAHQASLKGDELTAEDKDKLKDQDSVTAADTGGLSPEMAQGWK